MTRFATRGRPRLYRRWRIARWATVVLLMIVPLVAMQVTEEVDWKAADFAVFGALLGGTCLTFELAASRSRSMAYRAAVAVALGAAFVLVLVNGAVGIIGTERSDANLMYVCVIAIGLVGALIARLRADGMVRVLLATAVAQALVAAIALLAGWGSDGPGWPWDILLLTGFFGALWLTSARLFQKARSAPGSL